MHTYGWLLVGKPIGPGDHQTAYAKAHAARAIQEPTIRPVRISEWRRTKAVSHSRRQPKTMITTKTEQNPTVAAVGCTDVVSPLLEQYRSHNDEAGEGQGIQIYAGCENAAHLQLAGWLQATEAWPRMVDGLVENGLDRKKLEEARSLWKQQGRPYPGNVPDRVRLALFLNHWAAYWLETNARVLRQGGPSAFSVEQRRHPALAWSTFVSYPSLHFFSCFWKQA